MITLLHLTRVDDVTCFKHISFLFMVQKKRLEVNVGEIWNSLSIIVNIGKSRQHCLNENINDSLFNFLLEGTVTNPAIWLVLYSVSIFLSLPTGHSNTFVSRQVHPNFRCHFHKYVSFFRLGSIFKQTRRPLPQADK